MITLEIYCARSDKTKEEVGVSLNARYHSFIDYNCDKKDYFGTCSVFNKDTGKRLDYPTGLRLHEALCLVQGWQQALEGIEEVKVEYWLQYSDGEKELYVEPPKTKEFSEDNISELKDFISSGTKENFYWWGETPCPIAENYHCDNSFMGCYLYEHN